MLGAMIGCMRMSMMRVILAGWFVAGCADAATSDLPAGWEDAQRVEKLVQMTCGGSGLDDTPESLSLGVPGSELPVTYQHAHFRCVQPVEAFVRERDAALHVLVQPVDMDPDAVAGCDCRYTIQMQLPLDSEAHSISLFRRWDNLNSPNLPVHIGDATF